MSCLADLDPLVLAAGQQRQRRHRLALRTGGDDAHLARRVVVDVLDVDQRRVGDRRARRGRAPGARSSSCSARAWRPRGRSAIAASAICWMRWRWLAKLAVMIRRPRCSANSARSTAPTLVSLGAWPCSSALVESASSRRMPSLDGDRADAGEVGATAVDRGEVELEVARVQDHALRRVHGDGVGVRHRVGDGDELDVERADHAPLAVGDDDQLGLAQQPGLLDAVAGQAERDRRAEDREAQLAQQVVQRADVVLVAVGGDARRRCGRRSRAGR